MRYAKERSGHSSRFYTYRLALASGVRVFAHIGHAEQWNLLRQRNSSVLSVALLYSAATVTESRLGQSGTVAELAIFLRRLPSCADSLAHIVIQLPRINPVRELPAGSSRTHKNGWRVGLTEEYRAPLFQID